MEPFSDVLRSVWSSWCGIYVECESLEKGIWKIENSCSDWVVSSSTLDLKAEWNACQGDSEYLEFICLQAPRV
jgi:hypothetical protein